MNDVVPKISIIMCTYNRINFLRYSIESILCQTFRDYEFVLINNGSNDGSKEICEEYAEKDNRIKLINISENKGASVGRNRGLEEARGEYITVVDDDDYCEPTMIEFLWELANNNNADISICGSWYDYNRVQTPKYIFEEELVLDKIEGLEELLKRKKYNVSPPTKLFKRKLFKNIRFLTGVLVDDIHVIYKVFANADKIVAKGTPLYHFRKHESNMTNFIQTNEITPELLKEYLSMYRNRTLYLSKEVPMIKERARYSEWSYMISMCDKIIKYKCSDCMTIYHFMIKAIQHNYKEFINSNFITEMEKELLKKHLFRNSQVGGCCSSSLSVKNSEV